MKNKKWLHDIKKIVELIKFLKCCNKKCYLNTNFNVFQKSKAFFLFFALSINLMYL